jgi:hypothetical protein
MHDVKLADTSGTKKNGCLKKINGLAIYELKLSFEHTSN